MEQEILNVCLVGPGIQGTSHAYNIQHAVGARLACVVAEPKLKTETQAYAQRFGDGKTQIFYSLEDALKASDLNLHAIVIASPDDTHYPYVMLALQAGIRYIFCEKPLGISEAHVLAIQQQIQKITESSPNLPPPFVLVGFQRRYDQDFVALKEKAQQGQLGNIEILRISSRDPLPPHQSYNPPPSTSFVVFNSLIHDIDLAYFYLEEESPASVYAVRQLINKEGGPRDTVIAILKYPSGKLATIEWTKGIAYGYIQTAELLGDQAMARIEDTPQDNVTLYEAQEKGWNSTPSQPSFTQRYRETYAIELSHFFDLIRDRRSGTNKLQPKVTLDYCLHAARTAERIIASIAENEKRAQLGNFEVEELPNFSPLPTPTWKPLSSPTLNVALIGAGRMGNIRASSLAQHPKVRLLYIVDVVEDIASKLATRYNCKAVKDIDEALKDPQVNAVMISVGTNLHCELIKKIAAAGKPIFCEKPVSHTRSQIYESYEALAKASIPMMVGWNRRFDPHYRRLHALSQSDPHFGQARLISTISGDHPAPPAAFLAQLGTIFHDLMVHDIDIVLWFAGELPESVYAVGNTFLPEIQKAKLDLLDTAVIVLQFPNKKLTALLHARRWSPHGYDQRVEVLGESGVSLFADNPLQSTVQMRGKQNTVHDRLSFTFDDRYVASYAAEVDAFVEMVLGEEGKQKPSSFQESLYVAMICDAALKSAQTGKVVFLQKKQED